jgi:hypothetical protein
LYKELFQGQRSVIRWLAYVELNGNCRMEVFLRELAAERRDALEARMHAWAHHGRWNSKVKYVKQMTVESKHAVYEIKGFQERVLFIRCRDDAVAVQGFVKKNDWSKKDRNVLDAAMKFVDAAALECGSSK